VSLLKAIDGGLLRIPAGGLFGLSVASVAAVGFVDYLVGYEISVSLFYLVPVAIAAWYGGQRDGIAIAGLSCVSWYAADLISGHPYSHPAIPVWNAAVRFGFFAVVSGLVSMYHDALRRQRQLLRTDPLTGLANRRAFGDALAHDLALARRRGSALSLAYLDLDDFKAVNDTAGHAEGDRVLRTVGEVLGRSLREADTAARLGGDEFAFLLPDTGPEGAAEVAGKLARELQRAFVAAQWPVDASIGVVTFPHARVSLADAMEAADRAMYEAKRSGKGMVVSRVLDDAKDPP
jgi:diguanylate cyclase (GGDEF)-like protein